IRDRTVTGVQTCALPIFMALPLFRKLPWLRWALPLTAVVLLVVLGVVMFRNLNSGEPRGDQRTTRDKTENGDGGSRDKSGGDGEIGRASCRERGEGGVVA